MLQSQMGAFGYMDAAAMARPQADPTAREIPESLGNLAALTTLKLNQNKSLTCLPESMRCSRRSPSCSFPGAQR